MAESAEQPADQHEAARRARRARLDDVFGEVLPEQTADDAPDDGGTSDAWLRREVPPHHGS